MKPTVGGTVGDTMGTMQGDTLGATHKATDRETQTGVEGGMVMDMAAAIPTVADKVGITVLREMVRVCSVGNVLCMSFYSEHNGLCNIEFAPVFMG